MIYPREDLVYGHDVFDVFCLLCTASETLPSTWKLRFMPVDVVFERKLVCLFSWLYVIKKGCYAVMHVVELDRYLFGFEEWARTWCSLNNDFCACAA